ncbi:DUF914-domain-containing protein [Atractiella rhizophila]|nr:DUF914-domain-containing protein [Atractiella rhizophila]
MSAITPSPPYSPSPEAKRSSLEDTKDVQDLKDRHDFDVKSVDGQDSRTHIRQLSAWEALWTKPPKAIRNDSLVFTEGWREFSRSVKRWLKSMCTLRWFAVMLAGQYLSLAIVATNVETTQLGIWGWALPTTQTFFLYCLLNVVYTPTTIYKYGWKGYWEMLKKDGWKYFILAVFDVEGNYSVVKAYQYTDLLSCELLNLFATPVCMVVTFFLLKARFHWTQLLGVLICIGGLGMLVASDFLSHKNWQATQKVKGDLIMLVGATCYGISNGLEEFLVRQRPLYEVVGQLGFYGTIISGIQAAGLEHDGMRNAPWVGRNFGLLIAYTLSMFTLYTIAPILFRMTSSPFYNLSLLTSAFYGLLFGLFLYHYKPYGLYFPAYVCVISGLVIYFSVTKPEANDDLTRVEVRGKAKRKEEERAAANASNSA